MGRIWYLIIGIIACATVGGVMHVDAKRALWEEMNWVYQDRHEIITENQKLERANKYLKAENQRLKKSAALQGGGK